MRQHNYKRKHGNVLQWNVTKIKNVKSVFNFKGELHIPSELQIYFRYKVKKEHL